MFTKQIPHVRAPNHYGDKVINLPVSLRDNLKAELPMRTIVINGEEFDVPKGVYRRVSHRGWFVKIKGRKYFFNDDRHTQSVKDSLKLAINFLVDNYNKDPVLLPKHQRSESRIKNIEFGVPGVTAMWVQRAANKHSLVLRYQVEFGFDVLSCPITIRKENLTQAHLEDVLGMLVYMKHIVSVNQGFTVGILATIWQRIKKGDCSQPLPHPLPDLTMLQLEENLEMRKSIWAGKGAVDPITNKFVR